MKEPPEETIFEEREELMVSPFGGNPTLRVAHFLRPSISIGEPFPMLSSPSSPLIPTSAYDLHEAASKVQFKGWKRVQQKKWEAWIQSLQPKYQSIWKKAGIYEAIMCSKYYFRRHKELVLGLAEKWCPETNTFIFPWGEATITLEDMMVLGGFSVLGDSVSCPLDTKELVNTQKKLIEARRTAKIINGHIATHLSWLNHFMRSGSELEHLAFLSLWLSKFLFPSANYILEKRVFPIAIHLERGTRIALAPAVLSRIYEDLRLLKLRLMDHSTNMEKVFQVLYLYAPFQLVQLWVWERFPMLRSNPNPISNGEPRSARWHMLKPVKIENIRPSLDSAGECFQWRPYAIYVVNWLFPKFYPDKEQWVLVDSCLDQELESFTRCLRVCNLVGLDCFQQYLPHRVARQFGMDQNIPACVPPQHNQDAQTSWNKYNRLIGDAKIYLPPRLMESDVTTQYLDWWKQSILAQKDPIRCYVRKRGNSERVPPRHEGNKEDHHPVSVSLGFAPKSHTIEVMASCGGSKNSGLGSLDKPNNEENRPQFGLKSSSGPQCQNISHLESDDGGAGKMEMLENMVQGKGEIGKPEIVIPDAIEYEGGHLNDTIVSIKDNNEESRKFSRYKMRDLELQARISRLEGTVAKLKAERLNREQLC